MLEAGQVFKAKERNYYEKFPGDCSFGVVDKDSVVVIKSVSDMFVGFRIKGVGEGNVPTGQFHLMYREVKTW